jgi:putative oxygen-independent coproporphyrinogen III oxidase
MFIMPTFTTAIPLSLYIHLPWCVRKCPYCDFNSHAAPDSLPEALYVNALLQELDTHLEQVGNRPIISIFFGGGTPSLFSGEMIGKIITGVAARLTFAPNIEITLEANPGTIDQVRFRDFRHAGINRLSLGIQSLQDDKLKTLGRIHDSDNAKRSIMLAKEAGFDNFNIDLMYGLPNQSITDALHDLNTALSFQPTHLSWYQLTIEPNTVFYKQRPVLPHDDLIWEMQESGQALLKENNFQQYEVSAYATQQQECKHNRHYWEFGDYLGIGAGAHSKITDINKGTVTRFAQVRQPKDYLDASKRRSQQLQLISDDNLVFEFMLNALRLTNGVPAQLFTQRTGLALDHIQPLLAKARQRDLLIHDTTRICSTDLGKKFLNDLVEIFLA